jgi:hypothetical protein
MASVVLKRLILPALCALAIISIVEFAIDITWRPTFWQKSTWLMHDAYHGGEIFDRLEMSTRLSALLDNDPDIISVGDSSGFFSLQSTVVNRFTGDLKFLSFNTGANQAFIGYQAIAEYALQRAKNIKYVVLYVFPQLLPQEPVIAKADLGPITYDDLVGARSYLTPPSAFLSPYAKSLLFEGARYHASNPHTNHVPALQLLSTVHDALGWLPEFDVRYDRVDGRVPAYSDRRTDWNRHLGFGDPSAINSNLDVFYRMVRSYGAQLVVAFAPISRRALLPNDPNVLAADQALERFQQRHPEVKFLFPLITYWGPEKFGTFNHISREYTFLSSERLGRALARLRDPSSIPPYSAQAVIPDHYPPIIATPIGPPDATLLEPSLALYLYTSTTDSRYRELFSKHTEALLAEEPGFSYAIGDAQERNASLTRRHIQIGFDLSQLRATPIDVKGLNPCDATSGTQRQWVQLDGTMIFTYISPTANSREPVRWPEQSHIFVSTVVEGGVRKFDGYCPEPSMQALRLP